MSDQTPTWPPSTGVTSPTIPRNSQVFSLHASTTINAPASFIFNILMDTSTYPDWCTFVPKVIIDLQPSSSSSNDGTTSTTSNDAIMRLDTKLTFHACMGSPGSKLYPVKLVVTDLSTPSNPSSYIPATTLTSEPTYTPNLQTVYRVAWASNKSGAFDVGPDAERFHEVIVKGEEQCEVRTWECSSGVVAHVVKWMYKGTLDRKFEEWCADLKRFGERRWGEKERVGGGGE